jgi:hypothetical protein
MENESLDTLLDLDGQVYVINENGYFVKFIVKRENPGENKPHGLSYSLTLHDGSGTRLMGFDNAHAVKRPGSKFLAKIQEYDHKHIHTSDPGRPYKFTSASQLIEDFWKEVDLILEAKK